MIYEDIISVGLRKPIILILRELICQQIFKISTHSICMAVQSITGFVTRRLTFKVSYEDRRTINMFLQSIGTNIEIVIIQWH